MCRYAAECGTDGSLRVVDLCAGPGSLGACLASRVPNARIVAVDADPFLIEMGKHGHAAAPIKWVRADLRSSGWSSGLPGPFDTALCSTAMHWFDDEQVRAIYREVIPFLCPGGALLVADAMPHGTIGAQAASRTMLERTEVRQIEGGCGESWVSFWRAAEAEPAFAELLIERERVLGPRGPRVVPSLDFHIAALTDAGFTEIGEVWRRDAWAVVLAVR
ncbi:MAG: class I SAM-dependent methyltransferase [Chthoniobacterales bacterium]